MSTPPVDTPSTQGRSGGGIASSLGRVGIAVEVSCDVDHRRRRTHSSSPTNRRDVTSTGGRRWRWCPNALLARAVTVVVVVVNAARVDIDAGGIVVVFVVVVGVLVGRISGYRRGCRHHRRRRRWGHGGVATTHRTEDAVDVDAGKSGRREQRILPAVQRRGGGGRPGRGRCQASRSSGAGARGKQKGYYTRRC